MDRMKWFGTIVIAAASLLLSACGSTERVRYKMVVEVETPEGLRTGSAVREVTAHHPAFLSLASRTSYRMRGEAVMVDLNDGQTLYALLVGGGPVGPADYAMRIPDWLMGWQSPDGITPQRIEIWPTLPETVRNIDQTDERPMLVTFGNERDPATVVRIEPSDLAMHFGNGFVLKRITVEVSEEDVTNMIQDRLPWLRTYWDKPTLKPDPPQHISDSSDRVLILLGASAFQAQQGS